MILLFVSIATLSITGVGLIWIGLHIQLVTGLDWNHKLEKVYGELEKVSISTIEYYEYMLGRPNHLSTILEAISYNEERLGQKRGQLIYFLNIGLAGVTLAVIGLGFSLF